MCSSDLDNFPEPSGFEYGGPYSPESPYKPTKEQLHQIHERAHDLWSTKGTGRASDIDRFYQQASNEILGRMPERIKQIKGKGNAKPKKDYIPYVQDFVKSGNWSDIGDFHNTDLIRQDGKLMNKNEYADWMLGQLKPDQKADGGEGDAEEVFMGPKKVTHAHHLEIEERKL